MNDMVERVARAIYEAAPESERQLTWDECCEQIPGYADAVRKDARAAIGAMREPTTAMIEAMRVENTRVTTGSAVTRTWRIGIDTALADRKDDQ